MTKSREEWLKERRSGLGASDAAAICGLSSYKGPLQVYLEKKGLWFEPEAPAMRWGLLLEDAVALAYQETTGRGVGRRMFNGEPFIDRHPEHQWLMCSLDRVCRDRILELKTAWSEWGWVNDKRAVVWGEPGTDQIPREYLIQVQHQMLVTGDRLADVAVLIAGSDFRVYSVPANELLQTSLLAVLRGFWWRCCHGEAPPPDWSDPKTPELIQALYQPTEGKTVRLGEKESDLADDIEMWSEQIRIYEKAKAEARARLAELMGEANIGMLPDGREVVRKVIERKEYMVKATTYVDMRIRKGKHSV